MWQTETGGPVFGNPYGIGLLPIKPGSAGIPLPGIEAAVVTPGRRAVRAGREGDHGAQAPVPGPDRRRCGASRSATARDYWERIPGVYYTGDSAHIDEDGYVWFAGRADEIIKIAGHRIGTIEVETRVPARIRRSPSAASSGRPDELRGEVISAFVVLKHGHEPSDELRQELLDTVRARARARWPSSAS